MPVFLSPSDQLHLARSRFIDAHALVERAVVDRLWQLGVSASGHFLGNNLESLRKIPADPKYSKASRASLHSALDKLAVLQEARCDIVHGQLNVIEIGSEALACFINCRDLGSTGIMARLVTADQFAEMSKQLVRLADEIKPA